MATETAILQGMETELKAQFPQRIVTRDRLKWTMFTDAEGVAGLIVISSEGTAPVFGGRAEALKIQVIMVQTVIPASGKRISTAEVEDAEHLLKADFMSWVDRHNNLPQDADEDGYLVEWVEYVQPPPEAKKSGTAVAICEISTIMRR